MSLARFLRGRPSPRPNPAGAAPAASERPSLLGDSAAMRTLRADVARYADSSAPVLIGGETGTGKELVAHALWASGVWRTRPFVAVNVGAIAPSLLGSELFGHARGAFSGAVQAHRGLLVQAHGGTLFLDEVGEMPLETQVALLRVLETGRVRPLGAEREEPAVVRLLAATHRDLGGLIARGAFREDLYHRLNVLSVRVPPLRARLTDLPALAASLLTSLGPETQGRGLTPSALLRLAAYDWPGNVRQLRNVLWRAVVRARSEPPAPLSAEDIEDALRFEPRPREAVDPRLADADGDALRDAWQAASGNLSRLARETGLARSTLRERLTRLGLHASDANSTRASLPP